MAGTPRHPPTNNQCDHDVKELAFALAGTVSSILDFRGYNGARFYLPAEFNSDAISFQDAEAPDGTFAVSRKAADASVIGFTAHSAPAWYDVPAELKGAGAIKIVTGTATAAAATVIVCLKSGV
jgi:hypothetical protein